MSDPIRPFRERYEAALADGDSGGGLLNFQRAWGDARASRLYPLRHQGAAGSRQPRFRSPRANSPLPERDLGDRQEQLERFCRAAEAAGARVHRTSTAEEATRAIVEICQRRGAPLVAKGKTMVSEELFEPRARGGWHSSGRDRPRRVDRPDRPRDAVTHGHAGDPQEPSAGWGADGGRSRSTVLTRGHRRDGRRRS